MKLDRLARLLSDRGRIGLNDELSQKLGIVDADITRGRLMAQIDGEGAHMGVYLLGCYVVDDTDFFGDGEIYWWSCPVMVHDDGKAVRNVLHGLPNGATPHKCGDHEWMTNLSLENPPLLAVIPPDDTVNTCMIRLAIYDDDGDIAKVPAAMSEGLAALADIAPDPLPGPQAVIEPVRDAIYKSLRADQDDILIDQDLPLRRGEVVRFGRGMIGAVVNAMARVYYFVCDETHTRQYGPVGLHKGQYEKIKFDVPMERGGRLALFARGADVSCPTFGDLNTDAPFLNRVINPSQQDELADGLTVMGNGPAKLVAYYTPPSS